MDNVVIDRRLQVVVSGIDEIRARLPDPRRYPSAIAILATESEKLHKLAQHETQGWAAAKAREMDAALRVLGGELPR